MAISTRPDERSAKALATGAPLYRLRTTSPTVLGVGAVLVATVALWLAWGSGMKYPAEVGDSFGSAIDAAVTWMTVNGDFVFDGISMGVTRLLRFLKDALLWVPWPALLLGVGLLGWRMAGRSMALFSVVALLAVGFTGLWDSAMETLAIIGTSVAISIAVALPVGIAASRSDRMDRTIRPILDAMQTLPSFVYLVPAIMFFSLGNVPAVMATVIYSMPPAIRLTNLGIRQVSPEVVEATRSFGTTSRQLLLKVQMPMALPTIMAGINQTTMMALAMAVIASLVGAGGLGEDVWRALGRQEPGNSLIAGLGIVVLAIIIDRVTQGFARGQREASQTRG